jgi:hypothetical protein
MSPKFNYQVQLLSSMVRNFGELVELEISPTCKIFGEGAPITTAVTYSWIDEISPT